MLLSAIAVLAPLNLGGFEVVSGGAVGRGGRGVGQITRIADPSERVVRYALAIFPVYTCLTLTLWVLLLLAGDRGLVALCHAMSTLSTSGISPGTGLADSGAGRAGEVAILVFLAFAVTRRAFYGTVLTAQLGPLARDPELQMALACLSVLPVLQLLSTGRRLRAGSGAESRARPPRALGVGLHHALVPHDDRLRLAGLGRGAELGRPRRIGADPRRPRRHRRRRGHHGGRRQAAAHLRPLQARPARA